MNSSIDHWHAFINAAVESETEVRKMLTDIDLECNEVGEEPFLLEKDGEVVDSLCRAMAVTKIAVITDEIRVSMKRHDILGHLQMVIESVTILYFRDKQSKSAAVFEEFNQRYNSVLSSNKLP